MDRGALLDDVQWDLIEPLLPPQRSGKGRPMCDHRQVVEGVIYRYRCGIAWRDLPASFGPWQTVWKRHRRFSGDAGTWDKILAALLTQADARGEIGWSVSVDFTINRAHQHATNLPRGQRQATLHVESGADAAVEVPDSATGAESNDKDSAVVADQEAVELGPGLYDEPVHHAIGRSRGGLSSKIHQLVDTRGRPLVVLIGPGQANDSPTLPVLLDHLRVKRPGPGRPHDARRRPGR